MSKMSKKTPNHNHVVARTGAYKQMAGTRHPMSTKRKSHSMPHKMNEKVTGAGNTTNKNHC